MTTLYLVRHGATDEGNLSRSFNVIDGQGDPLLTHVGHRQARLLAERLVTSDVKALYVTNLTRTHETARPLSEMLQIEPIVESDLAELHLGDWEAGRYRHFLAEGDERALLAFDEGRWDLIPGAERIGDLCRRVISALERIAAAHVGEQVVVVTHRVVIGTTLAHVANTSLTAFTEVGNASITTLAYDHDRWKLVSFNDTAHLNAIMSTGTTQIHCEYTDRRSSKETS